VNTDPFKCFRIKQVRNHTKRNDCEGRVNSCLCETQRYHKDSIRPLYPLYVFPNLISSSDCSSYVALSQLGDFVKELLRSDEGKKTSNTKTDPETQLSSFHDSVPSRTNRFIRMTNHNFAEFSHDCSTVDTKVMKRRNCAVILHPA
jgi:hypothetical protein